MKVLFLNCFRFLHNFAVKFLAFCVHTLHLGRSVSISPRQRLWDCGLDGGGNEVEQFQSTLSAVPNSLSNPSFLACLFPRLFNPSVLLDVEDVEVY